MSKLEYVPFDLFDFQEEEVARIWMHSSRLYAWEMGTGKTYAGIATDLQLRGRSVEETGIKNGRKTLIICPKSVLDSWDQHCTDLTSEDIYVIDTKDRSVFLKNIQHPALDGYFIVHWEGLRLMPELKGVPLFHVIADECHRAKNRKTQQTRALKQLKAKYRTAMSGTPADNKPQDLWSVLNWLWPSVYRAYWKFVDAYCIMEMTPQGYRKQTGVKNVKHLHEQIAPWYSRKLKKDVLKDLPDKYYSEVWVDLDPKQRRAYDQMQETMVAWVVNHEEELERKDPIIAQAVVSQLMRLQQFAIGYMQPKLREDGTQITKRNKKGDDVPVWEMTDPSAKLDALIELIGDNEGEQLAVFSQFKQPLELLTTRLDKLGISYGLYTGDTSQADRATIVREFQAGNIQVFISTIAAGGVGITLTSASTVVFLDRSWSPALNAQAEDRLHRIGQKSAVQVIDFMAKNTVDISRKELLATKMDWLRKILGDQISEGAMDALKFTLKEKG